MSQGIPKSARELLAKQTAEAHLSPELLNAYAEQALPETEKQQVMLHLAGCADCREVVFVARAAAQEELEPALAAAAGDASAAVPEVPRAAVLHGHTVPQPKAKPPTMWWKWALPLTAVVIVGAAALMQRDWITGRMNAPAAETAAARQSAARSVASAPSPAADSTTRDKSSKASAADELSGPVPDARRAGQHPANRIDLADRTRKANPAAGQAGQFAPQTRAAFQVEGPHSNAPAATAASAAAAGAKAVAPPPASTSQLAEAAPATPLVQADNADTGEAATRGLKTESMAKSLTGGQLGALTTLEMERTPAAAKTRWRVSQDGHVEHTVGPNTWERVMSAEPVTFRVVATVGGNVWAGGSGGALFHSSDGGKHWERVTLAGEQGAITTIRFRTAQEGSVSSDSGATWVTTDGGESWGKQ